MRLSLRRLFRVIFYSAVALFAFFISLVYGSGGREYKISHPALGVSRAYADAPGSSSGSGSDTFYFNYNNYAGIVDGGPEGVSEGEGEGESGGAEGAAGGAEGAAGGAE